MTLLLRILGWATLLVFPCWLISTAYQKALVSVANLSMAIVGFPWFLSKVNIFAPCDIGIYLAMVLASSSAPIKVRALAFLRGLPALLVLEVITAMLVCVQITLTRPPHSEVRDLVRNFLKYLIDSTLLWNPSLVWLTILGRWEVLPWVRRLCRVRA